ncbi:hypothetical protein [Streptomyces sp. BE133]|uniref:hypothetical protein n=1 Tax=Streptomyces sp. BE133 TaxID=3002523 RepID=UPI002E78BA2D|nr:hypothetical protein [Streptomyces sp. BE133]MEE1808197.1 hypothetical protein [Streptomyces sp. BE133]
MQGQSEAAYAEKQPLTGAGPVEAHRRLTEDTPGAEATSWRLARSVAPAHNEDRRPT